MKEIKVTRDPKEETTEDPNDILEAIILVDDDDYRSLTKYEWYLKKDNANDPKLWHYSVARRPVEHYPDYAKSSLVVMQRQIMQLDGLKPPPVVKVLNSTRLGPKFDTDRNAWVFDFRKTRLKIELNGWQMHRVHLYWQKNSEPIYISPR